MERFKIPSNYEDILGLNQTQKAIKDLKNYFQTELVKMLNLTRVSAPLFVKTSSGLNDNLNGYEQPVRFNPTDLNEEVEVVHSLAKWKRMALKKYDFNTYEGIYADMNAIRQNEELDNTHSIYVDQWDWELIIKKEDRNMDKLKEIVDNIYQIFKDTEKHVNSIYPQISCILPEKIFYISSQELLDMYPTLNSKEREDEITKKHKAVFLTQIGGELSNGEKHDGRAPDYDDWSLNGDFLFWNEVHGCAIELSSMGIRVNEEVLYSQMEKTNTLDRKELEFHKMLLNGELPQTIGGGIGQSRLCMYFLRKAHIGEVQSSVWPEEMIKNSRDKKIYLL